jgi:1,4-alpha-glucan branching enzyme
MSDATQMKGMGALPHVEGVAFRVWAPHARRVSVIGSFNDWDGDRHAMHAEAHGAWDTDVGEAQIGEQYRFLLTTAQGEVTTSVGNAIVYDPRFDWEGDDFHLAPWNEFVIYERHVGTFNDEEDAPQPGQFKGVVARLEHWQRLGVNAIQIMPVAQFAGERSWGYNPAPIFAVELAYGGPVALKRFVKRAHQQGIAVILDVVYNHLGPSDLDLGQFDGWSEHNRGGIYFYNDDRAHPPWGASRPDAGRGEVRQYILDNVCMWFEEYHVDGLRFDATQFMHTVDGSSDRDLPEGWSLLQWINSQVRQQFPGRITIAEDLPNNKWLTKDVGAGGVGFGAQWDVNFVHSIRQAVLPCQDAQRSLLAIRDAVCSRDNDDAFDRVIYSASHDEVANGKARVPQEVAPQDPLGWVMPCPWALRLVAVSGRRRPAGGTAARPIRTLCARFQHCAHDCHRRCWPQAVPSLLTTGVVERVP